MMKNKIEEKYKILQDLAYVKGIIYGCSLFKDGIPEDVLYEAINSIQIKIGERLTDKEL